MIILPINSVIFYFSQSGGTKKTAEIIAEVLNKDENNCQLIRLMKEKEDIALIKGIKFSQFDLIGIGIPVYYFNPPQHILTVLEELPDLKGKTGFLFCTSGGNPSTTLHKIKKITDKKGLKIIDGNDQFVCYDKHQFYRDFNYVFPPSIGHPNEQDLKEVKNFGEILIKKALNPNSPEKTDFWNKPSLFSKYFTKKRLNKLFPKYVLDIKKCSLCGICEKNCPVDNIIIDPYPKWTKDCDRCYICEMECPEKAIQCDWDWMVEVMNIYMKKKGFIPEKRRKYKLRKRISIFFMKIRVALILLKLRFNIFFEIRIKILFHNCFFEKKVY